MAVYKAAHCQWVLARQQRTVLAAPKLSWLLMVTLHTTSAEFSRSKPKGECPWALCTLPGTASPPLPARRPARPQTTGHYSQLVWKGTRQIGCAINPCTGRQPWGIVMCMYDPPGTAQYYMVLHVIAWYCLPASSQFCLPHAAHAAPEHEACACSFCQTA